MNETLSSIALAAGLSWASGVRLYLALFTAGLLANLGWLSLPQPLQVLQLPAVMAVSGGLTLAEFLADKVPGFDSAWDAIHTFIRIPAGAILAAASVGTLDPTLSTIAAILGGTIAAGSHATKAGGRALINLSPEPFTNWTASLSEDTLTLAVLWVAFFHPWLLLAFLLAFFAMAIWLLPKLWRGLRSLFARFAQRS
jgi:hypothetical protein